MEAKDNIRFAEIMSAMAELYEMNLSDVVMEIWSKALEEFPIDTISGAVFDYMKNPDSGRFKPKPADIVRMISGSTTDAACLAWIKVDEAVRMTGDYQTVVFDDPIIHKTINSMGGWIGFGDVDEREWPFKAKDFQSRYRIYMGRGVEKNTPKQLTGRTEQERFKGGYDAPEPVLIGDRDKAQLVLGTYGEIKTKDNVPPPGKKCFNQIEGKR